MLLLYCDLCGDSIVSVVIVHILFSVAISFVAFVVTPVVF